MIRTWPNKNIALSAETSCCWKCIKNNRVCFESKERKTYRVYQKLSHLKMATVVYIPFNVSFTATYFNKINPNSGSPHQHFHFSLLQPSSLNIFASISILKTKIQSKHFFYMQNIFCYIINQILKWKLTMQNNCNSSDTNLYTIQFTNHTKTASESPQLDLN